MVQIEYVSELDLNDTSRSSVEAIITLLRETLERHWINQRKWGKRSERVICGGDFHQAAPSALPAKQLVCRCKYLLSSWFSESRCCPTHLLPRYQILSWFGEKAIGLCVLKEGNEVQGTLTLS